MTQIQKSKKSLSLYIREWGRINRGEDNKNQSLDLLTLNAKAWDSLANIKQASYIRFLKRDQIQIKGFVGVISMPDGTQIEVLPKINEDSGQSALEESRATLWKMLKEVNNLKSVESTEAALKIKKQALPEMLITWFLQAVNQVVQQGIRKDYSRIDAQERFLKGQLQLSKQLREPPHKQHIFQIEYDVFSANRPENRLLHSALIAISKCSKNNDNKKRAKHFLLLFDDVPLSNNYQHDFSKWAVSRDMHYYQPLLPWVKLILNQHSPFALVGKNSGISFLLPMETLFEKYVAKCIAKKLPSQFILTEQKPQKPLVSQGESGGGKGVFQMKPDIVICARKTGIPVCILDTKWKCIDQEKTYDTGATDNKRGISQSDMYQLFAYGKKYQLANVILVYPSWPKFRDEFRFKFDDKLTLTISPFDLKAGKLQSELHFLENNYV